MKVRELPSSESVNRVVVNGVSKTHSHSTIAAAVDDYSRSLSMGEGGIAANTGHCGRAETNNSSSIAAATDHYGSATANGRHSVAAATGCSAKAVATAKGGVAVTTWRGSSVSSTGPEGVAVATGDDTIIEVGPDGVAVCLAPTCRWIVRYGSILVQRWTEDGCPRCAIIDSNGIDVPEEGYVDINRGQVICPDRSVSF